VLLVGHGEQAYPEARERARRGRERLDRSDARHWTNVALETPGLPGERSA
jgi:hypothetical protein